MRPSKETRAVDGKLLSRLEWPYMYPVQIMAIVVTLGYFHFS